MATFLELVRDVERESGTVGQQQRLTTVANPVGRQEKFVLWTSQAWQMIQRDRPDWTFRRNRFSASLIPGQSRYTAAELGIADFAGWRREAEDYRGFSVFDPAVGARDETYMRMIDETTWGERYDFGSHQSQRPAVAAIDNERRLCVGPVPDRIYTLRGTYRRAIQVLALDDDTPFIDEDFHQAIVWRALRLAAEHDEASPNAIAAAQVNFRNILSGMVREYTEMVTL